MKQHITTKQVCELSEKAKKSLISWWEVGDGDRYTSDKDINIAGTHYAELAGDSSDEKKQQYLPLLSITQMIEFLVEHNHKEVVIKHVNGDWDYQHDGYHYWHRWGQELVDALWEAVKEVLEKGGDKR